MMNHKQNEKLMQQFRDRWKAIAAIEAEEQKSASLALRWQQLNSILCMAIGLGLPKPESSDDDVIVYQRWVKLRGMQNGFHKSRFV